MSVRALVAHVAMIQLEEDDLANLKAQDHRAIVFAHANNLALAILVSHVIIAHHVEILASQVTVVRRAGISTNQATVVHRAEISASQATVVHRAEILASQATVVHHAEISVRQATVAHHVGNLVNQVIVVHRAEIPINHLAVAKTDNHHAKGALAKNVTGKAVVKNEADLKAQEISLFHAQIDLNKEIHGLDKV